MKKQRMTMLLCGLSIIVLILDSETAIDGAKEGIQLCSNAVVPSLFPFFLISNVLTSNMMQLPPKWLIPIGRWFCIPPGAESLLIPAFLGGYPVGAQCVHTAYASGSLKKADAERLLAFCNNAGPSFIFGMCARLFMDKKDVFILWGIILFSAWITAGFFSVKQTSVSNLPKIPVTWGQAMHKALYAIGSVCGWVILFRILARFLNRWFLWVFPAAANIMLIGILELTNGICSLNLMEDPAQRFILCAGLCSFGGLCVFMQTASVAKELSIHAFLKGKILQCLISTFTAVCITYGFWEMIPLIPLSAFLIRKKREKISGNRKEVIV